MGGVRRRGETVLLWKPLTMELRNVKHASAISPIHPPPRLDPFCCCFIESLGSWPAAASDPISFGGCLVASRFRPPLSSWRHHNHPVEYFPCCRPDRKIHCNWRVIGFVPLLPGPSSEKRPELKVKDPMVDRKAVLVLARLPDSSQAAARSPLQIFSAKKKKKKKKKKKYPWRRAHRC